MFSMKPQAVVLFLLVSGSLSPGIDPGTFVGSVACEAEPQYSYALYLPSLNEGPDSPKDR